MEIGKVEKFDLSDIRVKARRRDEMATKLLNLSPGEGFVVDGVEQSNVSTRCIMIAKEVGDGRKFTTHRIALGKTRVIRVK